MATVVCQLYIRNDTAANWTSSDPTMALGEMGYESDATSVRFKWGDGSTAWSSLPYHGIFTEDSNNNVFGGTNSASDLSSGINNILLGQDAGRAINTGSGNVAMGEAAMGDEQASLGDNNIAIGIGAIGGSDMTTASTENIAIGTDVLSVLTSGTHNIVIGVGAAAVLTTGIQNVIIGAAAGDAGVGITRSVIIGQGAGSGVLTNNNIVLGYLAMVGAGGASNVVIGDNAVDEATFTGATNVIIGSSAGNQLTGASDLNLIIGPRAGPNTSGVHQNSLFINNAQSDTPLIGGSFNTLNVTLSGTLRLTERADHILTPAATFGEIWLKSGTNQALMFTDDAGVDWQLNSRGTTRATTTYTILVTDDVVFGNTDGAAWTATLPVGSEGQTFKIINAGSSGNTLTLAPNGAEHLIGVNSNFLLLDGETLEITYNATDGWY